MHLQSNDRFVRWHTVLREYLTFLHNALTAVAIAIVGGLIALLQEKEFMPESCGKFFFTSGLILCLLSLLVGCLLALNRLKDFRLTVEKIKSELTNPTFDDLKETKESIKLLGKITWWMFRLQVYFLLLGIASLIVSFVYIYNDKLF